MQVTGSWLAVSAGFLSATAGVFGKLAGTSAVALALAYYTSLVLVTFCMLAVQLLMQLLTTSLYHLWLQLPHGLQCNVGMTSLYIKSLQHIPSLQATVLSVASNICITVGCHCLDDMLLSAP